MRSIFWLLNKFFMVPMFRLGLGPFFGNPFTGYIMVLKVIGRKSGKVRYAPVNYAILDGKVYCVSGFRKSADWYKNLLAHPAIEAILPGGAMAAPAVEVHDQAIRVRAIRKILQNGGFAGFFEGFNPFRIGDEELLRKTADMPLICLQPAGVGNGASDPGGWAWVWAPVSLILLIQVLQLIFR
jgi:deazaflavin-dependent oxidoreductase (nitroreductase family)